MNPRASVWLLVRFLSLHLFNRFLTAFVCEKDPVRKDYPIGMLPMLGIGFHSLIDGFIYSIAFTASIFTGFLATSYMVLHAFPEGIIAYLLLAFPAAAVTTPAGMLISYPLVSEIEPAALGALLSFSAGALVYVGATRVLPRAEQGQKKFSLVTLGGGVFIAVVIVMSKV